MKTNYLALPVRWLVFGINMLFVESFVTMCTRKSVASSMFRLVIPFCLQCFEHFCTILAWITFTFMTSHMFFKIVTVIKTLPTYGTEERILSSMVLHVFIKSRLRCEGLVALAALQNFHFFAKFGFHHGLTLLEWWAWLSRLDCTVLLEWKFIFSKI